MKNSIVNIVWIFLTYNTVTKNYNRLRKIKQLKDGLIKK